MADGKEKSNTVNSHTQRGNNFFYEISTADRMNLEVSADFAFVKNRGFMSSKSNGATQQVQIGETDNEKEKRKDKLDLRIKRECQYLNSLTQEQIQILDAALLFIEKTPSTWIVNIFKVATSTRSHELAQEYDEAEMSFELRKNTWSEIWRHPRYKNKIYESLKDCIKNIPDALQDRLVNIARRIKKRRDLKTNLA